MEDVDENNWILYMNGMEWDICMYIYIKNVMGFRMLGWDEDGEGGRLNLKCLNKTNEQLKCNLCRKREEIMQK